MYSEMKKKELLSQESQTSGQEKTDDTECDCEFCLRSPKPRLQFESTRGHKFYYQTHSRKKGHS
jgi:hypothetical protein